MRSGLLMSVVGASAVATENSSVKKVITLLQDLKGKVERETAQGKADAEEYADWCIKSIAETKKDIEYGSQKVEEYTAGAEDGAARSQAAAAEVATLALEIGKAQKKQSTAAALRKDEHATFVDEERELAEADTMLGKAYSVLKRSLSLLQTTGAKVQRQGDLYTQEVVAALGAIIEATSMDVQMDKDVSKIRAFLEEKSDDDSFLEQPQASTKAYVSKSGGILEVIQDMQEKNAQVLGALRQKEMSARHEYELVMQDLKNTESSKSEQMSQQKQMGAKAEAAGKEAGASAAASADTLAADKKELSETSTGCEKAAKEWTAREADATAEMGVIAQAVEILSGKFGTDAMLLQVGSNQKNEAEFNRRLDAATLLRKLGRENNQYGLMQLAAAAQDDPFVKVRGMIEEMITKLEEEARKEASKEAKCQMDKEKGEKDLKIKKADFQRLTSRSEEAAAKFVTLGEEIKDLQQQLKELAVSVQAATSFRTKEKAEHSTVVADSAESIEALSGAIKVLTDYYGAEQTAFVQEGASRQNDSASVIIDILQTAQEDFEKLKQETESAESAASSKYDEEMQAADVAKAKKSALVEGKTSERSAVKVMASQIEEDLASATKALDAAQSFLSGVKESCANKAMSFEERQQRREAEIQGLREALDILAADETSFVQKTSFLSRK